MDFKQWLRLIWAVGGLALVLALLRAPALDIKQSLSPTNSSDAWHVGGFIPGGVFPYTNPETLPARLATVGSWNHGEQWQGEVETIWLPVPLRALRIFVAGYPQHPGCLLRAEFRIRGGSVVQLSCPIADPHETWSPWDMRPPAGAEAMRFVAEDHASDVFGWLAFSEPIEVPPQTFVASYMAAQVFATLALTLTLVWCPGLLWVPRAASETTRAMWLLGAGPLTLAALGGLIWLLGGIVAPTVLGFTFVAVMWLALGTNLWWRNFAPQVSKTSARALAVSGLCALAAVARAANSDGPDGELYGGFISRSLAVGDRSDSRISYYVPQIIHRHLPPASAEAEKYFTPWTFFSRGPLAGLAATPVLFATGGIPVEPGPIAAEATGSYRWQRFDSAGFAAYRIVLIALASMVIFALFAVLVPFLGESWALIGSGLLALCPFGVHEIMFTWPKFEATSWVLASFLLAHQRRSTGAGVALAVGFFYHPLAALWTPFLLLWSVGRATGSVRSLLGAAFYFAAGFGVLALPWMALGRLLPHLDSSIHAGQGGFFEYFRLAEYAPATWALWWNSRAVSFSNTFLPFWLHVFHEDNSVIGSVHGPVGPIVKFAFGWWNTLPLGLGLVLWTIALFALTRAVRRFATPIGLLLVGPALLLTAYWGAYTTGLMRECGHPLLAAVIALLCLALAHFPGRLASLIAHPLFPWLQLPETFLMLWLTTFLNPYQPGVDGRILNPLCFAINVLALGTAAWVLSRSRRDLAGRPSM